MPPPRSEPPWYIVGHRPERVRPREHKLLQKKKKNANISFREARLRHSHKKDEIRFALGPISERRLAEACPHDRLWCTGLGACNLRLFPCYLALEHAREILREETITPLCNPILPKTRFPWITHASLSCEVDPVAHIRLDTAPNTPSLFTDSVPDDYATEVLLAHTEQGPNLISYIPVTRPRNLRDVSV